MSPADDQEQARAAIGTGVLLVVVGDLTAQDVDVVVNAANDRLEHGGGVAAALSRAGGPEVQHESDAWVADNGPVGPGQAAVTTAGDMPAAHIVHVVGPRFRRFRDNEGLLRQAVRTALDAAASLGSSVAMPAISSGIYGYPPADAGRIITEECATWLADGGALVEVRLVGFDAAAARHFAAGLPTT